MSAARSALSLESLEALAPDGMNAALVRMRARAWQPIAFKLSLTGPTPDRLRAAPSDLRAGNPQTGEEIYKGCFSFAGATLHAPRGGPWVTDGPACVQFREELESFAWLRHLGAIDRLIPAGVVEAREAARAFAESWINTHTVFSEPAWAPAIVGRRIFSWLTEAVLLSENADLLWRSRFHSSLAQQARYLSSTMELAPPGLPRLTAMMGVVLGCLALGDGGPRRARAIHALLAELDSQILPDGGHKSRSPAVQVEILADLLTLKESFRQSNTPMPQGLDDAIARMMPMLRFFHVRDGRLAAFHGSGVENPETVLEILATEEGAEETWDHAPDSGFDRMAAGSTIVLVDSGPAPPFEFAATAHASALAFELISGEQRIVVNCGRSREDEGEGRVFRTAAAHSTLSFVTRAPAPNTRAKLAARLSGGPRDVSVQRHGEAEASTLLELSHDGYSAEFGRRHARRLYLQDGDLRGEDRIEPLDGAAMVPSVPFRLRFHLHPDIEVKAEEGGARLALPNGEMWRFRCRGAELAIADSIFNGPEGAAATKQLVIKGDATLDPVAVSWAFRRERAPADPMRVE